MESTFAQPDAPARTPSTAGPIDDAADAHPRPSYAEVSYPNAGTSGTFEALPPVEADPLPQSPSEPGAGPASALGTHAAPSDPGRLADHRTGMAATSAPQPVSSAASGPAAWPPQGDPGGGSDHHVTPRFPPEPAPHRPSPRFPADQASAPTTLPRWADSTAGAPGSVAFQAPRRAEEMWPALPALPALSRGTDTRPLGDDTEHLARLEREQEGL